MRNVFRWVVTGLLALTGATIMIVYGQNVEDVSTAMGLDRLATEGLDKMSAYPWLAFGFAFLLGATVALWLEFFLRKRFLARLLKKRTSETIEHQYFRHREVVLDGKTFRNCTFEGVTLVYKGEGFFGLEDIHFVGGISLRIEHPLAESGWDLREMITKLNIPVITSDQLAKTTGKTTT